MTQLQLKNSAVSTAQANQRRYNDRCAFIARADVIDLSSNSPLSARTADIDRGGCYIDTLNPLEVGAVVSVQLRSEGQSFKARAEVVYVQPGNGMGLAFTDAGSEESRILEKWIEKLNGATIPAFREPARMEWPDREAEAARTPLHDSDKSNPLIHLILLLAQKKILSEMETKSLLKRIPR